MGEGEERLLEIALANITIHAVSLCQVVGAELPEPARTHGAFRLSCSAHIAVCRRSLYLP